MPVRFGRGDPFLGVGVYACCGDNALFFRAADGAGAALFSVVHACRGGQDRPLAEGVYACRDRPFLFVATRLTDALVQPVRGACDGSDGLPVAERVSFCGNDLFLDLAAVGALARHEPRVFAVRFALGLPLSECMRAELDGETAVAVEVIVQPRRRPLRLGAGIRHRPERVDAVQIKEYLFGDEGQFQRIERGRIVYGQLLQRVQTFERYISRVVHAAYVDDRHGLAVPFRRDVDPVGSVSPADRVIRVEVRRNEAEIVLREYESPCRLRLEVGEGDFRRAVVREAVGCGEIADDGAQRGEPLIAVEGHFHIALPVQSVIAVAVGEDVFGPVERRRRIRSRNVHRQA